MVDGVVNVVQKEFLSGANGVQNMCKIGKNVCQISVKLVPG